MKQNFFPQYKKQKQQNLRLSQATDETLYNTSNTRNTFFPESTKTSMNNKNFLLTFQSSNYKTASKNLDTQQNINNNNNNNNSPSQVNLSQNKNQLSRPQTANSYKFLNTDNDLPPSKRLKKKQLYDKLYIKTGQKQNHYSSHQINTILTSSLQNPEYLRENNQQLINRQWKRYQNLKTNVKEKYYPKYQSNKQTNMLSKQSYSQDQFFNKRESVQQQKIKPSVYDTHVYYTEEEKIKQDQQQREEIFKQYQKQQVQNFKDQKNAIHQYLNGKYVDRHIIDNYKEYFKQYIGEAPNKEFKPILKDKKKQGEIQSQVHRKLKLPGYKQNKNKENSENKQKLKEFLANFLKGEKEYFHILNQISLKGFDYVKDLLELKQKYNTFNLYNPQQDFMSSTDMQLSSKECKIIQEQKNIFHGLKSFKNQMNYNTNTMVVNPGSPKISGGTPKDYIHSPQRSQRQLTFQQQQEENSKKIEEQKSILKELKEKLHKYKDFQKNFDIISQESEEILNQEDIEYLQSKQEIQQMIVQLQETIQFLEQKNNIYSQNFQLVDVQKHFLSAVKNNDIIKVNQYIKYNKELMLQSKDALGQTAIHLAAKRGHKEMLNLLITKGSKLKENDFRGRTPKQVAMQAHGQHNAIYEKLDIIEDQNFKKRKQLSLSHFMQDIHRIQKKFEFLNSSSNSNENDGNYEQDDNFSSDSGSEFLDNTEQPLRQKLIDKYQQD